MKQDTLKPGDIIDFRAGDKWFEQYGSVDEIKENGVVFTMLNPGHDGCRWTYKAEFENVRLSKKS